jgi:hypothetical protein
MAKQKTGLQWILQEASSLREKYPKRFQTWKEYVQQATAIYHSKKGDSMPRKKKAKKGTLPRKKKPAAKRKHKRRAQPKRAAIGKMPRAPHGTIAFHTHHVKALLENKVGDLVARQMKVTTKKAHVKLQKQIVKAKADYRRLQ